jgi:hypothetical protein
VALAVAAAVLAAVIVTVGLNEGDDRLPAVEPARGDVHEAGGRSASTPSRPAFAAARRFAASREGLVSFAVVDTAGRLRSVRGERGYVSASVVKALLLAAELRRLERQRLELDQLSRDLLTQMITYSDNAAADAIYQRVGDDGLREVATRAGMRDFEVAGHWTTAQLTAEDMAHFMAGLDGALVGRHAEFASAQLASIVPEQRWGIPDAIGHRWQIRFKGGWRGTDLGQLVHQAAALRRGRERLALAVLTDGQPTMEYGIATVGGIASRLLGPGAPAPGDGVPRRGGDH